VARPISRETQAAVIESLRGRVDGSPSIREIAARHGVSYTYVRVQAKENGIEVAATALTQVKSATMLRKATFAQQRAEIAQMMLDEARAALAEIRAGSVVTGISFGEVVCRRVAHTTARDRQSLLVAAGIALDKHRMLDQYDSDADTTDVVKFLNALGGAVTKAAES
jgi:hypothetical protein